MAVMKDSVRKLEVQGVKLSVDMDRFEDPRFTYALGKVTDESVDAFQKLKWVNRVMDTLFGEDETYRIMCELANGGELGLDEWNDFLGDVMEAASVKNS